MKKKTNDTLKNKSILIGLSVLCTGLIAVSFLENNDGGNSRFGQRLYRLKLKFAIVPHSRKGS